MNLEEEISTLRAELEGAKLLTVGLALSLARTTDLKLDEVAESLSIVAAFARQTIDPRAEVPIRHIIDVLRALPDRGDGSPEKALLVKAMLHADVDPSHQEALRTWLSTGTRDEIAEEIQRLFSASPRRSDEPRGGE